MSDEILKILKMVKERKITEKEGEALIESLRDEGDDSKSDNKSFFEEKAESLREILKGVKNTVSNVLEDVFKGIDLRSFDLSGSFLKSKFRRYLKVSKKLRETVKNVEIKIPEGELKIVGTSSDFGIRGSLEIRGNDEELLEKELLDLESCINESSESLKIEIPKEKQTRTKVSLEIVLPQKINLNCSCLSADIDIENIEGNINISNISGDITLSGAAGIIKASTKSGDFTLENLKGEIEASTLSSDIEAEELEGKIKLKSFSGDVKISGVISNQISVDTISGDITVENILTKEKIGTFSSMTGDIDLEFNEESGGNLILRTFSGEISINGELKYIKRERKELEGAFREGDAQIEVETKTGNITVSL